MADRIQRNKRTGEMRIVSDSGDVRPYNPDAGVPMHHPGLNEGPTEAFMSELGRTGKEAAIGLARSPLDTIKGLFGIAHPIDTLANTASAVAHPLETAEALGNNPREAGSLLGQLLIGKLAGPKVPEVAGKIPGAITAAGRGTERVGSALAESKIGGFGIPGLGAAEAVMQGDPKGLAVAAAPYALKYGGKGMQKLGRALEGLKSGAAVEPEIGAHIPNKSGYARSATSAVERPPMVEPPPVTERYAPNVGTEHPKATVEPPPLTDETVQIDKYMPNVSAEERLANLPRNAAASPESVSDLTDSLMSTFPSEIRATTQDLAPSEFGSFADNPEWFSGEPARIGGALEKFQAQQALEKDLAAERLGRMPRSYRSESLVGPAPSEIPASWEPYTLDPTTQSLQMVLEELRARPTVGLTNPLGR